MIKWMDWTQASKENNCCHSFIHPIHQQRGKCNQRATLMTALYSQSFKPFCTWKRYKPIVWTMQLWWFCFSAHSCCTLMMCREAAVLDGCWAWKYVEMEWMNLRIDGFRTIRKLRTGRQWMENGEGTHTMQCKGTLDFWACGMGMNDGNWAASKQLTDGYLPDSELCCQQSALFPLHCSRHAPASTNTTHSLLKLTKWNLNNYGWRIMMVGIGELQIRRVKWKNWPTTQSALNEWMQMQIQTPFHPIPFFISHFTHMPLQI